MVEIAIIGCGAAVQSLHLPSIKKHPNITIKWLVDINKDRAIQFAKKYGISKVTEDYTEVGDVSAVLIATPHHLHVPISEFFLLKGIHVLCEKPLSTNAKDAEKLVFLAVNRRLVLSVGVFRRYYPVSSVIRKMISTEWLGLIERIDVEEGNIFNWDLKSPFMLKRDKAGGGVLIDTGSHTLDRLLWWFKNPEANLLEYFDNSEEGVESDCEIRFLIPYGDRNIPVRVEMSRNRTLRNTFHLVTAHGYLEIPVNKPDYFWIIDDRLKNNINKETRMFIDLKQSDGYEELFSDSFFDMQLSDFFNAIKLGISPLNDASTVLPVIRLIEACYKQKKILVEPWVNSGLSDTLLTQIEIQE